MEETYFGQERAAAMVQGWRAAPELGGQEHVPQPPNSTHHYHHPVYNFQKPSSHPWNMVVQLGEAGAVLRCVPGRWSAESGAWAFR